jgi:hypothetical protein
MLKYVGKGASVPNIPARDLSADEVRKFGLKRLLKSGLYVETRRVVEAETQKVKKHKEVKQWPE